MPSDDGAVSSNAALADELEALNSIYEPDTLVLEHDTPSETAAVLRLPDLPFSFLVTFPREYPDVPPAIVGTQSTGGSGRGEGEAAVNILRDVLARVWAPGQVCLFDLVEEAGPLVQQQHRDHQQQHQRQHHYGPAQDYSQDVTNRSASSPSQRHDGSNLHDLSESLSDFTLDSDSPAATASSHVPPPAWILSEPLTVNKSTFVARACPVSSLAEAMDSISHLMATNKKVATATHNITAWRIQVTSSKGNTTATTTTTTIQDCDDDGESAAGGRLLHLMQLMDVWNVLVVVTRWYGGVKLGPDRFRCINSVAREVLVKGGFAKEEAEKTKGKGKGKK
ncbi:hypothetical protein A1O1_01990 [Capronia coronata CBS 617.96]|uniref:RWD domain-containing protein n=1 Tax=Capronia coronata CBS 617.96 TaxID=1182541 RepID=W9YM10_9EURO|nr:uncharacterized protein A1O1_01990 [Capronia coronata CBS 617.96]EXJ93598.1 hypothetical protein A1O1_01990 [Capronia coronata CBS 617.96]